MLNCRITTWEQQQGVPVSFSLLNSALAQRAVTEQADFRELSPEGNHLKFFQKDFQTLTLKTPEYRYALYVLYMHKINHFLYQKEAVVNKILKNNSR